MKRKFFTYTIALFTASLMFTSCGKDGDVGPAGSKGDTGGAGPAGPKGEQGTANVIYSDWLDVSFGSEPKFPPVYFTAIDAPKLTADVLSTAEIKVFVNFNTAEDPLVTPLPYIDGDG